MSDENTTNDSQVDAAEALADAMLEGHVEGTVPTPSKDAPQEVAKTVDKVADKVAPAALKFTGNATLDAGLSAIQAKSGLTQTDFDRATNKAIQYGDADLIDRAFLMEKYGEDAPNIEALARATLVEHSANIERGKQLGYAAVGGEENWNAVAAQFKATAPASLQKAMRAAIDADPAEGALAVLNYVQAMSGQVGGHESRNFNGGRLPLQSGGTSGTQTGGGITKEQFQEGLEGIQAKFPRQSLEGNSEAAKAFAELAQRRTYGRKIGM